MNKYTSKFSGETIDSLLLSLNNNKEKLENFESLVDSAIENKVGDPKFLSIENLELSTMDHRGLTLLRVSDGTTEKYWPAVDLIPDEAINNGVKNWFSINSKVQLLTGKNKLNLAKYKVAVPVYKWYSDYNFSISAYEGLREVSSGNYTVMGGAEKTIEVFNRWWTRLLLRWNSTVNLWEVVGVGSSTSNYHDTNNNLITDICDYVIGTHANNIYDTTSHQIIVSLAELIKSGAETTLFLKITADGVVFNNSSETPTASINWDAQVELALEVINTEDLSIDYNIKEAYLNSSTNDDGITVGFWKRVPNSNWWTTRLLEVSTGDTLRFSKNSMQGYGTYLVAFDSNKDLLYTKDISDNLEPTIDDEYTKYVKISFSSSDMTFNTENDQICITINDEEIDYEAYYQYRKVTTYGILPEISTEDNQKILEASDGEWVASNSLVELTEKVALLESKISELEKKIEN